METKTAKQRKTKQIFKLTLDNRKRLDELCSILELFEWFTSLMQSNEFSISCVYPCVISIRKKLRDNIMIRC